MHLYPGDMTTLEIIEAYNKLTGKNLQKFENRKTALRRYAAAVCERNPQARASDDYSVIYYGADRSSDASYPEPEADPGARDPEPEAGTESGRETSEQLPRKRREGTKGSELLTALQSEEGTTVAEVQAKTGWKPHTVRAAISVLRKEHKIMTEKVVDRGRVYRIHQ